MKLFVNYMRLRVLNKKRRKIWKMKKTQGGIK